MGWCSFHLTYVSCSRNTAEYLVECWKENKCQARYIALIMEFNGKWPENHGVQPFTQNVDLFQVRSGYSDHGCAFKAFLPMETIYLVKIFERFHCERWFLLPNRNSSSYSLWLLLFILLIFIESIHAWIIY